MVRDTEYNKAAADDIELTLDDGLYGAFVGAMYSEVDFLRVVSKYPLLFSPGPVLNNAIRR